MRTSHWAEELKILNYIYSKKLYIKSVQPTGLGSLNVKLNTENSKHNSGSHLPEQVKILKQNIIIKNKRSTAKCRANYIK